MSDFSVIQHGLFFVRNLVAASVSEFVSGSVLHYQGVGVLCLVGLGVNHTLLDISTGRKENEHSTMRIHGGCECADKLGHCLKNTMLLCFGLMQTKIKCFQGHTWPRKRRLPRRKCWTLRWFPGI